MKRIKVFLCLIMVSAIFQGFSFEFVTVSDVVKQVKNKFKTIETYSANFKLVVTKDGKKKYQSGTIKSRFPDKLLINFYSPRGQKIVSNGKMMWIYIPSLNVVAEQDINKDSSIFSSNTKAGLNRLFKKYHYKFASTEQPEVDKKSGKKHYTLLLKQKESRSGFKKLKLWIQEDFFIKKAEGETASGKRVEITFSKIKTNMNLKNGIFKFNVPSKARVIKNPMISEE